MMEFGLRMYSWAESSVCSNSCRIIIIIKYSYYLCIGVNMHWLSKYKANLRYIMTRIKHVLPSTILIVEKFLIKNRNYIK